MSGIVQPLPAFTRYFKSSAQAVVVAGGFTIAHGFGVVPKVLKPTAKCLVAINGWSVGDVIDLLVVGQGGDKNLIVWADATNIYGRFNNSTYPMHFLNKSTGVGGDQPVPDWEIYIEAWA